VPVFITRTHTHLRTLRTCSGSVFITQSRALRTCKGSVFIGACAAHTRTGSALVRGPQQPRAGACLERLSAGSSHLAPL